MTDDLLALIYQAELDQSELIARLLGATLLNSVLLLWLCMRGISKKAGL